MYSMTIRLLALVLALETMAYAQRGSRRPTASVAHQSGERAISEVRETT